MEKERKSRIFWLKRFCPNWDSCLDKHRHAYWCFDDDEVALKMTLEVCCGCDICSQIRNIVGCGAKCHVWKRHKQVEALYMGPR